MAATRLTTSTTTVAGNYYIIGGEGAVLASADSIAIDSSFHEVTGSTTVNTITGGLPGMGLYLLRPTGATWTIGTSGNIEAASISTADRVVLLVTPDGNTWYGTSEAITVTSANSDITVTPSAGSYQLTFNPANVTLDEFTGPLAIAKGGTGQTAATAAFDALAPTTTAGDIIYHNGTDNVRLAKGTASQLLQMDQAATAPAWSSGLKDSVTVFYDNADGSKQARFECSGISASTTRVITLRDADLTMAGTNVANTFSAAQTFSSTAALNGNVTVGSTGSTIKAIWYATKTWDPGSISAQASAQTTVTVTGAAVGDPIVVTRPDALYTGSYPLLVGGEVTSANTVTLTLVNPSATAHDAGNYTYYLLVFDCT